MHNKEHAIKATDILVSHHMFLRALFDEIERALPDMKTFGEIDAFARMVEGVMIEHAASEENLLFSPLESLLLEKGQIAQLYTNHKECVGLLRNARLERPVEDARAFLRMTLRMLRDHFRDEERMVLRLAEETFRPESLQKLGKAWMLRHPHEGLSGSG